MGAPNPVRQRAARRRLDELFARDSTVFVIHYACQSFNQSQAHGSPRIAAIAVRNLADGRTTTFSIHQELELGRVPPQAAFAHMDHLERSMLDRFNRFLAEHRHMTFVHWNMRDLKFGFAALEHRFSVLGGQPQNLAAHQRFDLALLMPEVFGSAYAPRPHIEHLARMNGLTLTGYIPGDKEPGVFNTGEFSAVNQSTLCKVSLISDIARLVHSRTLKTQANWWTLNAGRVREAVEMFEDNPIRALAGILLGGLMTGFTLVSRLMH